MILIVDDKLVASCVCVIIPNLTRNVHPYAFVENVVTHGDYRKKGYATACLNFAKQIAKKVFKNDMKRVTFDEIDAVECRIKSAFLI